MRTKTQVNNRGKPTEGPQQLKQQPQRRRGGGGVLGPLPARRWRLLLPWWLLLGWWLKYTQSPFFFASSSYTSRCLATRPAVYSASSTKVIATFCKQEERAIADSDLRVLPRGAPFRHAELWQKSRLHAPEPLAWAPPAPRPLPQPPQLPLPCSALASSFPPLRRSPPPWPLASPAVQLASPQDLPALPQQGRLVALAGRRQKAAPEALRGRTRRNRLLLHLHPRHQPHPRRRSPVRM